MSLLWYIRHKSKRNKKTNRVLFKEFNYTNYRNYYITTDKAVICLYVCIYIYIWMHQLLLFSFPCIIGMYRSSILKYCIDRKYRSHTESKLHHLHFVPRHFKDILLVLSFWFVNIPDLKCIQQFHHYYVHLWYYHLFFLIVILPLCH